MFLRRYARSWPIEKSIAEQLAFFHLNGSPPPRSSRSIRPRMTVLAHISTASTLFQKLPALLETLAKLPPEPIPWFGNGQLVFLGATRC